MLSACAAGGVAADDVGGTGDETILFVYVALVVAALQTMVVDLW